MIILDVCIDVYIIRAMDGGMILVHVWFYCDVYTDANMYMNTYIDLYIYHDNIRCLYRCIHH